MVINGQNYTTRLKEIVESGSRYRIAVVKSDSSAIDPNAINLGLCLAHVISNIENDYSRSGTQFQMLFAEAVECIIKDNITFDRDLGNTVVIDNLGILFESELNIDCVDLFNRLSKNALIILLWHGEMDNEYLYFLSRQSQLRIKQSDINYIII